MELGGGASKLLLAQALFRSLRMTCLELVLKFIVQAALHFQLLSDLGMKPQPAW